MLTSLFAHGFKAFELLSGLEPRLPGFSRNNWRSTIRGYVNEHADYANLEHWPPPEESDIVYNDTQGVLTSALIERGHLASGAQWRDQTPTYYIEVKAT